MESISSFSSSSNTAGFRPNNDSCWVGSFLPHEVRRILHIPTEVMVVELMTLGYPADTAKQPDRLPPDQIACREKWSF